MAMRIEATSAHKEAVTAVSVTIGAIPALAPGLLRLFKAAGDDPVKLNALVETALTGIKDALSSTAKSDTAKAEPYTAPALIEKYKFETFETALGTGYRFTQPEGVTLLSVAAEINKVSQELIGRDAIYQGVLLQDDGMNTVPQKDIVHECVPLVNKSNNRRRGDQEQFLKDKGTTTIDRPVLTISAGLQRLNKGDPTDSSDIGTSKDEGDIFKGQVTRARSGALASDNDGVDAYGVRALGHVFVAGAPLAESKN